MNPHRGSWGFAAAIPFAQMVVVVTLAGTLFTRKRNPFPIIPVTIVYLAFLVWISLTELFAMNSPEIVFARWIFAAKVCTIMLFTLVLLRGRQQIEMFDLGCHHLNPSLRRGRYVRRGSRRGVTRVGPLE